MKKTYRKLLIRSVWQSRTRFLSILAIVGLGVGFLGGLIASTPDMQLTADSYYDDMLLYDIDIKCTLGLTDDELEMVSGLDMVESAQGVRSTDVSLLSDDGSSVVARLYAADLSQSGNGLINDFVLTEGRMPESENEILVVDTGSMVKESYVGKTYTFSPSQSSGSDPQDTFAVSDFVVTGIIETPQYMSVESESSTAGSGEVGMIAYLLPEAYSMEEYTDIFVTLSGAKELMSFSDEYSSLLDESVSQLEGTAEEIESSRFDAVIGAARSELDDAQRELDEKRAEAQQELNDAKAELDAAKADIDEGRAQLSDARSQLALTLSQLNDAQAELDQSISDGLLQLEMSRELIGEEAYQQGLLQLEMSRAEGQAQIDEGMRQYNSAKAQLDSTEAELENGYQEYLNGLDEYEKSRSDAEAELTDAQAVITEARIELESTDPPEVYITDRRDSVSYNSYKGNSEKVGAIATVFPVFFFFVAALVALTTMTRMVEEDRTQIGTLKALGYSARDIMFYYISYSACASIIGSLIGMMIGFKLLPAVISNAYSMMYVLPRTLTPFWWQYAVIVIPIAVAVTTLSTYLSCAAQLTERPASLMLPRAPKAGKRIFLEYLTPLWKHFSFIHKVTARNIFRYKKRFFMTVIGIAGCSALLLAGFGIRDSISGIVDKQFGEIYLYDLSVYLTGDLSDSGDDLFNLLGDPGLISDYGAVHMETGEVESGDKTGDVTIYLPQQTDDLTRFINLRERRSGDAIPFDDDSFILTEKLCDTLGIGVGDSVTVKNSDGTKGTLTVTGICENYVSSFAFVGRGAYDGAFGLSGVDYNALLIKTAANDAASRDSLGERLLSSGDVALIQFSQTIRDAFSNTVSKIDYIVIVLIISAGGLAVIVLYNLTNINICERRKELATIKVLGFHEKEVSSYIYRETWVLCVIGILLGFVLGIWLHSFVMQTAEVDMVMFGRDIYPLSYILSAAITLIFTGIVDLIMLPKIKGIDMVDSMKANE